VTVQISAALALLTESMQRLTISGGGVERVYSQVPQRGGLETLKGESARDLRLRRCGPCGAERCDLGCSVSIVSCMLEKGRAARSMRGGVERLGRERGEGKEGV